MFTGIVEKTGKLAAIEKMDGKVHFKIAVKGFLSDVKIGSSIAVDGVCLTVIKKNKGGFTVELMPETLRATRFSEAEKGDLVNLEKALKIGERIDGHFVMGHVDGVGSVKKIIKEGDYTSLVIATDSVMDRYLAYKGSIAVNGVSLTISDSRKNWFKVSLITHTLKITNLSRLKIGSKVNLEADMMARYIEKFIVYHENQ